LRAIFAVALVLIGARFGALVRDSGSASAVEQPPTRARAAGLEKRSPAMEATTLAPSRAAAPLRSQEATTDHSATPLGARTVEEPASDAPARPESPRLHVLCVAADDTPISNARVQARIVGEVHGDLTMEYTDAEGRARLDVETNLARALAGRRATSLEVELVIRQPAREPFVVPDRLPTSGEVVVRVPPYAVLNVQIPASTSDALGPFRQVALAPRGADPPSLGFEQVSIEAGRARRIVLGPLASGSYDLWTYMPTGDIGGNGVSPVERTSIEIPPGISEHVLAAPRTRDVTLLARWGGYCYLVHLDPADGTIALDMHGVPRSGRCRIDHAPDRPFVVAYVPNGRRVATAFALLPVGVSGEVVMQETAPGMSVLVTRGESLPFRAGRPREAPIAGSLRSGDVITAIDGAPVADALRPFGVRLGATPGAPPLRLSIRRGGVALEVIVDRAALARDIETIPPPLFVPIPSP